MVTIQLADEASYAALSTEPRESCWMPQQERALKAFSVMAEAVSTRLDVDSVLHEALDQTLATLEVEAGAITLLEDDTRQLVFRVQKGWQVHDFAGQQLRIDAQAGMTGIVMRSGHPLVTDDITHDPRIAVDEFREEPVRAMILAPLRARQQVLGVLSVMSYQPRRFTMDEVALLAAIADQVGVALDNARLYQQELERRRLTEVMLETERRRARELNILRDAVMNMSGASDLLDLLEHLCRGALQLSPCALGVECDIYDEQHDRLTLGMALHPDGSRRPLCAAPHHTMVSRKALQERRMQKLTVPSAGTEVLDAAVTYIIAIPMQHQAANGVLLLGYEAQPQMDEQTENSLSLLAEQASLALSRLHLYHRERRKSVHLALVNHISQTAMAELGDEAVLCNVVRLIQQSFGLYNVSLYLGPQLSLHASSGGRDIPTEPPTVQGLAALAAEQKRGLLCNHIESDPRCFIPPWVQGHAHSELAVPLIQRQAPAGEVLGVLELFSIEESAFDEMDRQTMLTLAQHLATLIENSRLYADLEQRNRRLHDAYIQLRELEQLKDQIIQNISHEMRTPLTFIKGYTELLSEGQMGELNQEQLESLEIIARQADAVTYIVEEIVSLRTLTADALSCVLVPIAGVFEQLRPVFEKRAVDAGLSLTMDVYPPDLSVYGESEKIKRMCYNILDNAIKFSPGPGKITVIAVADGEYVHLKFEDQGIGIPEQYLNRIFDTFYQVDGSTTRRFNGLGIGLAVVQRIVEAHRGKVWAESQVGSGTTFHILLPRHLPTE